MRRRRQRIQWPRLSECRQDDGWAMTDDRAYTWQHAVESWEYVRMDDVVAGGDTTNTTMKIAASDAHVPCHITPVAAADCDRRLGTSSIGPAARTGTPRALANRLRLNRCSIPMLLYANKWYVGAAIVVAGASCWRCFAVATNTVVQSRIVWLKSFSP